MSGLKAIRLTAHAIEQCAERGTDESEVREAIRIGKAEDAKSGRKLYRHNGVFGNRWKGKYYKFKQVAPVVVEEDNEIVVVTVYAFYF